MVEAGLIEEIDTLKAQLAESSSKGLATTPAATASAP